MNFTPHFDEVLFVELNLSNFENHNKVFAEALYGQIKKCTEIKSEVYKLLALYAKDGGVHIKDIEKDNVVFYGIVFNKGEFLSAIQIVKAYCRKNGQSKKNEYFVRGRLTALTFSKKIIRRKDGLTTVYGIEY